MRYFHSGEAIEFVLAENKEHTYGKHNHVSKYVAGLILTGCVEIFDGVKTIEAIEDDLFIIPIYRVHALKLKDTKAKVITMCVGVEFLEQYSIDEGKKNLTALMQHLFQDKLINEKQESAYLDAYDVIYQMYQEQEKLPEQIHNITQKVIHTPEMDWNLDDLANSIYINKYYFIRKFKDTIGLTPHFFQIQNRIRKAQHLLQEGYSVTDTAMEMGFYDQSHFDKAFRNIMGISPKEYLESLE